MIKLEVGALILMHIVSVYIGVNFVLQLFRMFLRKVLFILNI